MHFSLAEQQGSVRCTTNGYTSKKTTNGESIADNIPVDDLSQLQESIKTNTLLDTLRSYSRNDFLFIHYDYDRHTVTVANDHFGSHEILFYVDQTSFVVTDSLRELKSVVPDIQIAPERVHEYLAFGLVQPPATIFSQVFAIPAAYVLTIDIRTHTHTLEEYWNPAQDLQTKYDSYESAVTSIRDALHATAKQESSATSHYGVSLSGGVDSGGLASILYHEIKAPLTAITIGPYGKDSFDLKSARKTAKHINADYTELYPNASDLKKLPAYMSLLNQPLDGQTILTNGLVLSAAAERGVTRMLFGFGTDNMLGCQRYSQLAAKRKTIAWLPDSIQRTIAFLYTKLRPRLSFDQKRILTAATDSERFLYIKSIHFGLNQKFLRQPHDPYKTIDSSGLTDVFTTDSLSLIDQYVFADCRYIHNYNRHSMVNRLARPMGISAHNPAYTPISGASLLHVTDTIRAKNNWDKEVFREAVRPTSPTHLYTNQRKSCILEIKKWFADPAVRTDVYETLRNSDFIMEYCDVDVFFETMDSVPTPEIFLLRLLGLHYWHTAHFT